MGLSLAHGGHLTHGMKLNVSGKLYHVVAYGVDESGRVDMEQVRELALAERPQADYCRLVRVPPSAGLRCVPRDC